MLVRLNAGTNKNDELTATTTLRVLFRVLVHMRWVQADDIDFARSALPEQLRGWAFTFKLRPKVRKMTWAQGMGRHSKEDILHITRRDLTALSDFLGGCVCVKPFMWVREGERERGRGERERESVSE